MLLAHTGCTKNVALESGLGEATQPINQRGVMDHLPLAPRLEIHCVPELIDEVHHVVDPPLLNQFRR